jgi:DNA repair photolyase
VTESQQPLPHRGTPENPPNRFEPIILERDPDWDPREDPLPRTQFLRDASQTIISYNDSPDIAFDASVNPYRGCEHGCVYCYARPTHEYLGFSSGLDFETRIMVKLDAPELLRAELASPKWKPQVIALCGVTDAYQPVERRLRLTRGCLEVLAECRNPAAIVTKNRLVTRDLDLLTELAHHHAATVYLSLTTLDTDLRGLLEPRTSPPAARLAAMRELAAAGVPVGILAAPIIPGLNDHELPALLGAASKAGARFASYVVLRLPHALSHLFEQWLETHVPEKKERVLNRIRALRGGALTDSRFERRMEGQGVFAEQISHLFDVACRKHGLDQSAPGLSTASFERPELGGQLPLFH